MLNLFKNKIKLTKFKSKDLLINSIIFQATKFQFITLNPILGTISTTPKQKHIPKSNKEIKMSNTFDLNPDNLDDYVVIGAEIFQNAVKESYNIVNKGGDIQGNIDQFTSKVMNSNAYRPMMRKLEYPELPEYDKNYGNKVFIDNASTEVRHMFTPSWREKYEYLDSKDMFRFSMVGGTRESHNEEMFKRMDYARGFQRPFRVDNQIFEKSFETITNYIKQHPENKEYNVKWKDNEFLKSSIQNIIDEIPNINHSLYANLCLKMFYDINLNVNEICVVLEQEILNNLQHLSNIDLSRIYFVTRLDSPKYTSTRFKTEIEKMILSRLRTMNLEDFLHVCIGFRLNKCKDFNNKLMESLINMKNQLLENKPHENLGKLLLAYAANKPKHYGVRTFYENKDSIDRLILAFEKELNENIGKMNSKEIARVAKALYILKYEEVDLFVR